MLTMAPHDFEDDEDGFHPFKGLASFTYSIVDRSNRSETCFSINESNAACKKSHASVGGRDISSTRLSLQNDDNSSSRSSNQRAQNNRHAIPPTKIMTRRSRRVNTFISNNRRIVSPTTCSSGMPTFSKYLKYNNQERAKESGKYRRTCDVSSTIDDVSSVPSSYSERRYCRSEAKQQRGSLNQREQHCEREPRRGVHRNISAHMASSPSLSPSSQRQFQSSKGVNPTRDFNTRSSCDIPVHLRGDSSAKESRIVLVAFKDAVRVRCISYAADLLPHRDPERILWYNQAEYDMIYQRSCDMVDLYIDGIQTTTTKADNGRPRNGTSWSSSPSFLNEDDELPSVLRGLEGLVDSVDKEKDDIKSRAWDAVLDEQCFQRDKKNAKVLDDKEISNVYKLYTFKSQCDAIKRAKNDEREVQQYLENTRQQYGETIWPAACTSSSSSMVPIYGKSQSRSKSSWSNEGTLKGSCCWRGLGSALSEGNALSV